MFRSIFTRNDVAFMFRLLDRLDEAIDPKKCADTLLSGVAAMTTSDHAELSAWACNTDGPSFCVARATYNPDRLTVPPAVMRAVDEPLPGRVHEYDVRTWTTDGSPGWGGPGLLSVRAAGDGAMTLLALRRLPGRRTFSCRDVALVDALNRCNRFGEVVPTAATVAGPLEMSHRLAQVLDLLLKGLSEKQVANALSISPHTVHVYVKGIYRRFGVSSRSELLSLWIRDQLSDRAAGKTTGDARPSVMTERAEPFTAA